MEPPNPSQKKGLGGLAWLGIGCGGIIVLVVIAAVLFSMFFGTRIKQFADEAVKDPTHAMATTAITFSGGKLEMVAEDAVNKRYTLREKTTGKLTTIYWDPKKQAPTAIPGDFSAIPASENIPATPAAATPSPQ